jgi:hypothetical protein
LRATACSLLSIEKPQSDVGANFDRLPPGSLRTNIEHTLCAEHCKEREYVRGPIFMFKLQARIAPLEGRALTIGDLGTRRAALGRILQGYEVDYRLSMVAAMDSATRDNGGSRCWRALWAGFSLVRGNYAPAAKRLVACH